MAAVLVVTFVTGGSSQESGPGDAIAQVMALPVLVAAIFSAFGKPAMRLRKGAAVLALLVALLPAFQLLPVPEGWWASAPQRAALLRDLHVAGVQPRFAWTLTPAATERALWSQLPALAMFFGALALGPRERVRLMHLLLALISGGVVLGTLQMLAGQDSVINPFPQWVPVMGGVFANPNHQANALVIGAVLSAALWLHHRRNEPRGGGWTQWTLLAGGALCLLALPATGSRAGMLLAVPALAALAIGAGRPSLTVLSQLRSRPGLLAGAFVSVIAAGWSALRVLGPAFGEDARWPMARGTVQLASEAWPLGTGVGSFRPWFEQTGPDALLGLEYINHAHNEYIQWWLEGGAFAAVLLIAVLATFVEAVRRLFMRRVGSIGHAAWIGVAVLLAGSAVDYPLRTPALMAVGAFLAGVAVARATRPGRASERT